MIRTTQPDGSTTFQVVPGDNRNSFSMPGLSDADKVSIPVVLMGQVIDSVGELFAKTSEVSADPTLNDFGKSQRLDPIIGNAIDSIAANWGSLNAAEHQLNQDEAALLSVPAIDPSNAVAAIEAREIRDYWRSLSKSERTATLKKIDSEPGHQTLVLALLRAPIGSVDHEVQFVRDVWNRSRRLDSPEKALAIQAGRANVAHARIAMAHATGIARRAMGAGWNGSKILNKVLTCANPMVQAGYGAFGISAEAALQERRQIAARSMGR